MDAYIYAADIYCEDCGRAVIREQARGERERDAQGRFLPISYEGCADSDQGPVGPFADGGGEADCPQHCGSHAECLNAIELEDGSKVGAFLENDLTTHGREYVEEAINEFHTTGRGNEEVLRLWAEFYSIEFEPGEEVEEVDAE